MSKLKIFMTAYDVNPFEGSESGMGWNFAFHTAQYENVSLVTRKNNRKNIESWINQNQEIFLNSNLNIIYYDLPNWVLKLKMGRRFWALYYYLWQFFLALKYRKEIKNSCIAHSLNFHSDLFPSFLWLYNKNFFWGPINHHEIIPADQILMFGGPLELLKDRFSWFLKLINWKLNPLLIACQWHTKVSFCGSSAVKKRWQGPKSRTKFVKLSSVGISRNFYAAEDTYGNSFKKSQFKFLSIGRFVSMKSFELSVLAYTDFLKLNPSLKTTQLVFIGSGPNKKFIDKCIKEVPDHGSVKIIPWIEYKEVPKKISECDAFLFPSHEGAGMVVVEALFLGLPVICLNNNGPSEMIGSGGVSVDYVSFGVARRSLAIKMSKIVNDSNYFKDLALSAKEEAQNFFWDIKAKKIVDEYRNYKKVIS